MSSPWKSTLYRALVPLSMVTVASACSPGSLVDPKTLIDAVTESSTTTTSSTPSPIPETDTGDGFNGTANQIAVESNDAIYILGSFTEYDGTTVNSKIVKINQYGELNTTFNTNAANGFTGGVNAAEMGLSPAAGGGFFAWEINTNMQWNASGENNYGLKINADGTSDASWNPTQLGTSIHCMASFNNAFGSKVMISYYTSQTLYDYTGTAVQANAGGVNLHGCSMTSAGKLIQTMRPNTSYKGSTAMNLRLIRFDVDTTDPLWNTLDATWAANAGTGAAAATMGAFFPPDLSYVLVGATTQWGGANYAWNGGLTTKHIKLYKINMDGTEDNAWTISIATSTGPDYPVVCGVDSTGDVYFTGAITSINGTAVTANRLYRVDSTGAFEREFTFNGTVNSCRVLADDKILAVGAFTTYDSQAANRIVFLQADGTKY